MFQDNFLIEMGKKWLPQVWCLSLNIKIKQNSMLVDLQMLDSIDSEHKKKIGNKS